MLDKGDVANVAEKETGKSPVKLEAVGYTSADKKKALIMYAEVIPGAASNVSESLRKAHMQATEDKNRGNNPQNKEQQDELLERLYFEKRLLDAATQGVVKQKAGEAQVKGETSPDILKIQKTVMATEVEDELKRIMYPVEELAAKDQTAVTRELNEVLYPVKADNSPQFIDEYQRLQKRKNVYPDYKMERENNAKIDVPVAKLIKASRDLVERLSRETAKANET